MRIRKLFIANRGEIAVRIIRSAKALGIQTVQAASDADLEMLACKLADNVVNVGPAQALKSYLSIDRMMEAILASGADAVHPGYGFLSENPRFAEQVEKAGLTFVGPRAETIAIMGDKARAREEAIKAGVPVVPGTRGRVADLGEARRAALEIGYPVMIKASAGGGGRGIRVAHNADELEKQLPLAMAEARAAFGDDGLYLERFIARARHVEVQILGDGESVIHLYERECSIQRNRQKIWEEAPAIMLPEATRTALCQSATALARRVGYRSAGTLEYLYDDASGEFFFIEMNTRIQVEHPVTEAVTGIDIVEAQLRIASGELLWLRQEEISLSGHALEVRINAENPTKNFMPSPGLVTGYTPPETQRFDTLLYEGCRIVPYYDSLIGKLIVHCDNRAAALIALRQSIETLRIEGIHTTIPLHRRLAQDPDVVAGTVHTGWLVEWMARQPG